MLNNVETFCAVPAIIRDGGAAFARSGIPKNGGTRMICLSGHVNKPGVYELPLGFPLKQMIEEVGGGIADGKKLKAFIPGGSSCPVLTAEEWNAPMDYDSMARRKSDARVGRRDHHGRRHLHGEGGAAHHALLRARKLRLVHPLPRRHDLAEARFYALPRRRRAQRSDIDLIGDLAKNMLGRTFCPLGDAAAMPTISIVEKFRHEFEDHLNGKPCPYEQATKWRLV